MSATEGRIDPVRVVLGCVASLSRVLSSEQRRPFEGRVLTGSQLSALFYLARTPSGLTPGRLAELLSVSAGAVTQLVETLRTDGHVDMQVNPYDARSRIIVLSRAARVEVEQFERATAERLRPRFAALTSSELMTLAELMNRIAVENKE